MVRQQFEYSFDHIGNRTKTGTGGDENGWNLRTATYTANLLNQYTNRTVPGYIDIIGVALATKPVYVNDELAYRKGGYFRKELSVNSASAPVWQSVIVEAPGEQSVGGHVFVPRTPEQCGHDADGNMTNDGRWSFTWDAENRLVKVESRSNTPQTSWRRVQWTYDAKGRRIRQTTSVWTNSARRVIEDLKFISDPMPVSRYILELNATNNSLVRSYVWGLDFSGTMDGTGGVGGLLWLNSAANGSHFCTYDGNGNVVGLVSGTTGTETARHEYGLSHGRDEPIRVTGPMAKSNSFRYSTKRTDNTTDFVLYEYHGYNPTLGRWLGRDPLTDTGLRLVSHTRTTRLVFEETSYLLVRNNPLGNVDVLGLCRPGCPRTGCRIRIAPAGYKRLN
ncbi:RHS repeat-associated core domain-containing protein [Limisphaera sp. 4302-co]|uniref:RHS repeat-associated core domain-containing protein n=1 Tax=Limisphaera sp. 4302-co TaxID=3400417 RepID=UPI003C229AE4